MNIKRGLKRIWVVGSVLWSIGIIGLTISTFPEQPKEKTELQKQIEEDVDAILSTRTKKDKTFTKEQTEEEKQKKKDIDRIFSQKTKERMKQIKEEEKFYEKEYDKLFPPEKTEDEIQLEKYEKKKKKSLLILLKGFGVLVFMWGLLYTGFWIGSGFSSDKKKDETNE